MAELKLLLLILLCLFLLSASGTLALEKNCEGDDLSGRCEVCKPGWYGAHCATPCPAHCDEGGCNKTTGRCIKCEMKYFGTDCSLSCSVNCTGCERDTGECVSCKQSRWGSHCEQSCPFNCNTCSKVEGTCTSCKTGWWGNNCTELCPDNCRMFFSSCNFSDGGCGKGCLMGHTGPRCEKQCSSGCLDNVCSQLDARCTRGCVGGWYGSHCNMSCIHKCLHCNQTTGLCESCEDGWYGFSCSSRCHEDCVGRMCYHDGTCIKKALPKWGTILICIAAFLLIPFLLGVYLWIYLHLYVNCTCGRVLNVYTGNMIEISDLHNETELLPLASQSYLLTNSEKTHHGSELGS